MNRSLPAALPALPPMPAADPAMELFWANVTFPVIFRLPPTATKMAPP